MSENWKCAVCGKAHEGLPMSFAADFPDMYANMTRQEREIHAIAGSDQVVIDQQWFFIRGCLELPIKQSGDIFLWGLWASVREDVYDQISDSWNLTGRERARGPFKGRLANSLSVYPSTLNLKLEIRIQPVGTRPLFFVEELGHPLASEQKSGINSRRALELASLLLHQQTSGTLPPNFP